MTESQKGDIFILSSALIWSLFPVVTVLGIKGISSMTALFWATSFSIIFFSLMMTFKKRWKEAKNFKVWKYALGIAIFNGVIYYGLYFYALTKTLPANAAIVALFEVVTSYVFFQLIHKEHISRKHILGIIIATIGAIFIFLPKVGHFYIGDLFIIIATFLTPFGNSYAQKARKLVSSETLMFIRNLIAIPFLFVLVIILGTSSISESFSFGDSFWWLILNGLIILGLSKIFWTEGIHRISVTKALALGTICLFFTIIFTWIIIGQAPTLAQLLSLPLLILGILLLTDVKIKFLSQKTRMLS
jgi:drug/metabolite transporter (DMT)-like permease